MSQEIHPGYSRQVAEIENSPIHEVFSSWLASKIARFGFSSTYEYNPPLGQLTIRVNQMEKTVASTRINIEEIANYNSETRIDVTYDLNENMYSSGASYAAVSAYICFFGNLLRNGYPKPDRYEAIMEQYENIYLDRLGYILDKQK